MSIHRLHIVWLVAPLLVLLAACTPEPRPIAYGSDHCARCVMTISDARFGAELVTAKGKVYTFDSVECMAAFIQQNDEVAADVHSLWVADFQNPGELVEVSEAQFLRSESLRSPMGMNLVSFGTQITEDALLNAFGGEVLTWPEVLALAGTHEMGPGHTTMHEVHDTP